MPTLTKTDLVHFKDDLKICWDLTFYTVFQHCNIYFMLTPEDLEPVPFFKINVDLLHKSHSIKEYVLTKAVKQVTNADILKFVNHKVTLGMNNFVNVFPTYLIQNECFQWDKNQSQIWLWSSVKWMCKIAIKYYILV